MSKNMDIYAELDKFVEENEGQVSLTDVAKHFAEYGYQYAIDKACEWLRNNLEYYLGDYNLAEDELEDNKIHYAAMLEELRNTMEE